MTSPRPDADTSATGSEVSPDPTVRGDDSASRDASAGAAPSAASGCSECHKYAGHCPYCHSPRPLIAPTASPAARSMHPRETPETRPDVEGLVERVRAWLDNDAPPAALKAEGSTLAEDIRSALSAYEGRLQEVDPDFNRRNGEPCGYPSCGCEPDAICHVAVDAARASAAEKDAARLRETLGQISRMRTMPDDKMNTFTLGTAHRLAFSALEQKPEVEG